MRNLQIVLAVTVVMVALLSVIFYNTFTLKSKQFIDQVPPRRPTDDISAPLDEMIERLSQAVQIPTISNEDRSTNDLSQILKLHKFLEKAYPRVHSNLVKETINNYSLLYTWEGSDPTLRPFMLASHLDVVPLEKGTENQWTHPPFGGKVADGFIWGRGTMDDKNGVCGILEAVEDLLSKGFVPRHTIFLAFGHDEEILGRDGAYHIGKHLENMGVELEFLIDEGMVIAVNIISGLDRPVALIGTGEKGWATLEISVETAGGHSSSPPLEPSSIALLSEAVLKVEQNPFPPTLGSLFQTMDFIAVHSSFINRIFLANIWLFKPILLKLFTSNKATNAACRTTTAVTMFNAGVKENVIPSRGTVVVNHRILLPDTPQTVLEYVRNVVNDPRINVQIRGADSDHSASAHSLPPAPDSPTDADSFIAVQKTVHQVFPEVYAAPGTMIANTDTKHYWHLTKNIYRFCPMFLTTQDIQRIHGVNERMSLENYYRIANFYNHLIRNGDADLNGSVH